MDPGFVLQKTEWLVVPFTELQIAGGAEGRRTPALSTCLCAASGDTRGPGACTGVIGNRQIFKSRTWRSPGRVNAVMSKEGDDSILRNASL